jgi:hypothetical protein
VPLFVFVRAMTRVRSCTRPMNTFDNDHDQQEDQSQALLHLPLAGLLPLDQKLVINASIRTATLFSYTPDGEAQIVAQQQFSPNGMRVLLPLLQAYPRYCPYDVLAASLFSLSLSQARQLLHESWEMAMRPVRRAISGIMDGLHALGLSVRSLRKAGYVLEALTRLHL